MKKLKLGHKIALGSLVLLTITSTLTILNINKSHQVRQLSKGLRDSYIPDVQLIEEISKFTINIAFNIRGYSHSHQPFFYESAKKSLKLAEDALNKAIDLDYKQESFNFTFQTTILNTRSIVLRLSNLMNNLREIVNKNNATNKVLEDTEMEYFHRYNTLQDTYNKTVLNNFMEEPQIKFQFLKTMHLLFEKGNDIVRESNALANEGHELKLYQDLHYHEEAAVSSSDVVVVHFDTIYQTINQAVALSIDDGILTMLSELLDVSKAYEKAFKDHVKSSHKLHAFTLIVEKTIDETITTLSSMKEDNIANLQKSAAKNAVLSSNSFLINVLAISLFTPLIAIFSALLIWRINLTVQKATRGLLNSSDKISTTAKQLSKTSEALGYGVNLQTTAIKDTSLSLEAFSNVTDQNEKKAKQAHVLMEETSSMVQDAENSMKMLITSIENMSQSSQETQKIIKTIDEISFQTNLLSLNASIEASKVGDFGAGFAAVADEVRNLAMRATEASKNTSELIKNSVSGIQIGMQHMNHANAVFEEMGHRSTITLALIRSISNGSEEQSVSILDIQHSIKAMNEVTEKNSKTAAKSSDVSKIMANQSKKVQSIVKILVDFIGQKEDYVKENYKLKDKLEARLKFLDKSEKKIKNKENAPSIEKLKKTVEAKNLEKAKEKEMPLNLDSREEKEEEATVDKEI